VYRRQNERFAANCIQEADRFGSGSVMMWGAISDTGGTNLVHVNGTLTAQRYCDEILQHHVVPITQINGQFFQRDNARPHTACVIITYLQNNNIPVLPWPPKSPDLNPIEHLWYELDRRVGEQPAPQSLQEVVVALQAVWANIPQQVIRNLTPSIGRRCQALIDARLGHTRYCINNACNRGVH
jgi:transposase